MDQYKDVDEAFDAWVATFGRNEQKRNDAFNALNAAKSRYADGDKKRKIEIDAYVEKRKEEYLDR